MPQTIDPFAETQPAWWWRLLFGRSGPKYAPSRYAKAAGFIGPFLVWAEPHRHGIAGDVIAGSLLFLPPALVEAWYKQRQRRRDEQLLPLPERQPRLTRIRTAGRAIPATPRTREAGPKAGP